MKVQSQGEFHVSPKWAILRILDLVRRMFLYETLLSTLLTSEIMGALVLVCQATYWSMIITSYSNRCIYQRQSMQQSKLSIIDKMVPH